MKIETLKKAEEFKRGDLNLVQTFLKRGCTFQVQDKETGKIILSPSSNYEDIRDALNKCLESFMMIIKGEKLISRLWLIPSNGGIDAIADYTVSNEIDKWSDKFERTMLQVN